MKMKKSDYNKGLLLFIVTLLVSFTLSAQEVTKEFHKEFNTEANTTLEISNKYGDVVVETWDKNQVVIDVKVTVELPNRDKAEKLLSYINVEFSEGNDYISAKTEIDDKFSFSGWGGGSKRFSIDYNVKMPSALALTLANRYGNTDLDDLSGLINLEIKYGNLTAGKMTRGNTKPISNIYLAYGKGSMEEAGWLDLTLRYCGAFSISKSQALLLDSKYSKLALDNASSLVGESKYDNIRIEKINNMVLENGYTEVTIGMLNKKLEYQGSYGSFTVDNIPAGFESLDVETRYMGVKLGISDAANYKLDAKVRYGGLKYDENNFDVQTRIVENNSNEVSGTVGKGKSPSGTVNITSSYGSVRLY